MSTLQFASRAKLIKNKVSFNTLERYKNTIQFMNNCCFNIHPTAVFLQWTWLEYMVTLPFCQGDSLIWRVISGRSPWNWLWLWAKHIIHTCSKTISREAMVIVNTPLTGLASSDANWQSEYYVHVYMLLKGCVWGEGDVQLWYTVCMFDFQAVLNEDSKGNIEALQHEIRQLKEALSKCQNSVPGGQSTVVGNTMYMYIVNDYIL